MKYRAIVFCRHKGNNKTYLFEAPTTVHINSGDNLLVDTMYGECPATAACNSFVVTEKQLSEIISGTGAYTPIKRVTGLVQRLVVPNDMQF